MSLMKACACFGRQRADRLGEAELRRQLGRRRDHERAGQRLGEARPGELGVVAAGRGDVHLGLASARCRPRAGRWSARAAGRPRSGVTGACRPGPAGTRLSFGGRPHSCRRPAGVQSPETAVASSPALGSRSGALLGSVIPVTRVDDGGREPAGAGHADDLAWSPARSSRGAPAASPRRRLPRPGASRAAGPGARAPGVPVERGLVRALGRRPRRPRASADCPAVSGPPGPWVPSAPCR